MLMGTSHSAGPAATLMAITTSSSISVKAWRRFGKENRRECQPTHRFKSSIIALARAFRME